ncbi:MAG: ATP-binding protein [Chloroflexia bacterium]|nr:ATP-binding protein [Chloroflexia bacterium]
MRSRPAFILGLSLGGLLIAIAITGLAGLAINQNVADITARALEHDVNLEDEGDDLRAAVLDLRHYHRDLVFLGPNSPQALLNFSSAYMRMHEQIDDYAEIERSPGVLSAEELETSAETYFETFEPAIGLYYVDRVAFDVASDQGLAQLEELDEAAQAIDRLGEDQAEASLANVDRANQKARFILLGVLGGLVLVGVGLVWSAFRVVTQIRELYEAQQASAAKLADAVRAKTDFIADASHELRTPLTVLRGNAEAGLVIESACGHREILEEIVAESVRMTRLVADLLFLARSDAESLPLRIEPVEAEPFAVDLAERAGVLVRQHGHALGTALAGHGTIHVDATRIEQAVMILVDNAAKYSLPNSKVSLNTSTWNGQFVFEVVDSGAGMLPDELAPIFERFYRVDKVRSRRLGGAGLGLSIAKTIVDAHGGRIAVESQVDEGTKMRIQIPLARNTGVASSGPGAKRRIPLAPGPVGHR